MTPKNLSISFGPSISDNFDINSNASLEGLFSVFVEECETIFQEVTQSPEIDTEPLIAQMISFLPRRVSKARKLSNQFKMSPRQFGFKGRSRSKSNTYANASFSMVEVEIDISEEEYSNLPSKISVEHYSQQSVPNLSKATASLNLNDDGPDSKSASRIYQGRISSILFQAEEMARELLTNSETELNELSIMAAKSTLLAHRIVELEMQAKNPIDQERRRSSVFSNPTWGKGAP